MEKRDYTSIFFGIAGAYILSYTIIDLFFNKSYLNDVYLIITSIVLFLMGFTSLNKKEVTNENIKP